MTLLIDRFFWIQLLEVKDFSKYLAVGYIAALLQKFTIVITSLKELDDVGFDTS